MKHETQYIEEGRQASLLQRWKPLLEAKDGQLAPLKTKAKATMTAILLENQYNYMKQNPEVYGRVPELATESLSTQGGTFTGYGDGTTISPVNGDLGNSVNPTNNDFYAKGDSRLPNVIMPMIRRTFPELLANEIVGVQPMSGPVGMAFALRFKYDGENLADFTPDGGNTANGAAPATRSFGQEAGYNYLNTQHTGVSSANLGGDQNPVLSAAAPFAIPAIDQGVANLLKNLECSTALPQMSMGIEKTAVEAGSRKLALKYSLELEQDLKNMHGISVDDEMTSMMSYEIQAEIDREILIRMLNIALNGGAGRGWSTWTPANADGRWSAERAVNLWQHIRVQARLVSLRNRRGAANFAVVTPYAAAILETLPNFKSFTVDGNVDQQVGNSRAGTLGNIKVFVDTRSESQYQSGHRADRVDYILLGYKGTEAWDSGLIYLPYIPVMVQRTMGPNDFSPRIGLATRYAIAANLHGAENYYHVIILKDLTTEFDVAASDKKFMW
jgi:hypothetical protein